MISLILWFFASIMNGCMDMNLNMYSRSIFYKWGPFYNPNDSWTMKWKNGDREQGERFFGSSTIFVWLTDSWHLFKILFLTFLIASVLTDKDEVLGLRDLIVQIGFLENLGLYYIEKVWLQHIAHLIIYASIWFAGFETTIKLLKLK